MSDDLETIKALLNTFVNRTARPYYPLADNWGLTLLASGQLFFVNTRDRTMTPWIIMGGHWEPNVDLIMMTYIRPGMTVVDIGANMGYYTVKLASALQGQGRMHAFEPNPEVSPFCSENLKINGLVGIARLHPVALGEREGLARLTVPISDMASANLLDEQAYRAVYHVDVRTLDDVLPTEQLDLIKLDAEGYEPQIFRGAAAVLGRSPDCAVMLELNLQRWERSDSIEALAALLVHEKLLFAVTPEGRLRRYDIGQIKDFLLTRPFTECYFFCCPPSKTQAIEHLIISEPEPDL